MLKTATEMSFDRKSLSDEELIGLYKKILKPRMIEEKMLLLLRKGRISKWFSGIGQEAIAVGVTAAMKKEEYILPMHRNLGVFTGRDIPLNKLFKQFEGKYNGFTKGRDRSFHFGTKEFNIVGMISHLGPQLSVADGIALSVLLKNEHKATAVFTGEGGTSEGEFHEALNVAAVWGLPVIFIVENNGYGLSTPTSEQFKCKNIADKGIGYGMKSLTIDGNNILEVYHTIDEIVGKIRKSPQPYLVECMTFRMRGHEEASGTKYVPQGLFDKWKKRDPVINFEKYLEANGILNESLKESIKRDFRKEIDDALEEAFHEPDVIADASREKKDVYRHFIPEQIKPLTGKKSHKRFVDAVSDGLRAALRKFPELIFMGQDIAEYGGVFKVSQGFLEEFGKHRIRNTPLCESAIIGAGLGLSIGGFKAVIEMQFADFVTCGFNQIVNNLAKIHYRWGQNADVVIRMPTGAGVGAGPFHSQSNESWFAHVPGLKIVYPSNPFDAKGLLLAAVADPNPVMYFEHKALYRSITGEVPDNDYTVEIGKAELVKSGSDVSIITYGMGVQWALRTLERNPGISADLLDLRTLLPLDLEAIENTVKNTGKVIILHEDTLTGGIGGEIAAWICQRCFEYLDGPIVRVGSLDTPIPFAAPLEKDFLPQKRFETQLLKLVNY